MALRSLSKYLYMKKVLIVDDEEAGRKLIREYLTHHADFVLIGEATNGIEALKMLKKESVDLIFLDIQMPGMTGFDVLQLLDKKPNIIFSTAYDEYALEAFEVSAVDYLLKPYTKERFDKAVQKVYDATTNNLSKIEDLANYMLDQKQAEPSPKTILVRKGQKYVTLQLSDIIWIAAEKDYSSFITKDAKFLSNYGISLLEQRLPNDTFLRIHRSSIINIHYIAEVFKNPASYDIRMHNGDQVKVSRSYLDKIKDIIF